jgi:glycosyltransferase involved in cell wall biosynthesis
LRKAIGWADVVHAHNPSPDVALFAKLRRRRLLINVINHRVPGRSLRQRLWDFSLRQGDRRFYISDFVRQTWEGPRRWKNSEVVFPICELTDGTLPPEQRRGFVFAARWIPNKGIETLVDAYAQAALDPERWPLVLIGDGPLRPEITRRVASLGLRGVETPGFLTQVEKAACIRRAKWMVVPPNTREDFGLTAIEARHVGVPCIITRDGGVPEAAGEEALACEPGDAAGLAACLRAAAAMPEAEYAARASRTRETLVPRLAGPEFYACAYQELAGR